jgi:hypothetical protein
MARRSVVGGKSDLATANRRRSSDVIVARGIRIPSLRREDFKIDRKLVAGREEDRFHKLRAKRADCEILRFPAVCIISWKTSRTRSQSSSRNTRQRQKPLKSKKQQLKNEDVASGSARLPWQ